MNIKLIPASELRKGDVFVKVDSFPIKFHDKHISGGAVMAPADPDLFPELKANMVVLLSREEVKP